MKYISTRGKTKEIGFEEVVTTGLAPDGGLFMPKDIPIFSQQEISSWKNLSYQELAEKIMLPYVEGDIPQEDLRKIIRTSYSNFRNEEITPLHKLSDNEYVLELFHGPTLAFKDVALQFLGNLLDYILDKQQKNVVIIGATSGDTGSAAIEGCRSCKHIELFMLHPYGRVSDVQRKQMTTIISDNIHNLAIETDFDGCQSMVKDMFANQDFLAGKSLTAVNSINWARIMAQIVYYFYAGLKLGSPEKEISFSVPTGNFGDIFAGYIAMKMGLPIKKLIVATNKNDILHRFFENNDYRKTGVDPTLSPSMDIQISSNFERLLFDLHNQDSNKINELMYNFNNSGKLSVTKEILLKAKNVFDSSSLDDDGIKQVIKDVYDESKYIVDPHTATGIAAARKYKSDDNPMVILSTAHPAKFPDIIKETLNIHPALPEHLSDLMERKEKLTKLKNDIEKVKSYIGNCEVTV